jgi:hypothetical protein
MNMQACLAPALHAHAAIGTHLARRRTITGARIWEVPVQSSSALTVFATCLQ